MMPMPMQAPMAPRPMMRPAARATKPRMCSMLTPSGEKKCGWWKGKAGGSVLVVGLAHVDERQHHEDEGLQQHDQDVEDGPAGAGDDMAQPQRDAGGRRRQQRRAHERD